MMPQFTTDQAMTLWFVTLAAIVFMFLVWRMER
jgi:hypothetical protein